MLPLIIIQNMCSALTVIFEKLLLLQFPVIPYLAIRLGISGLLFFAFARKKKWIKSLDLRHTLYLFQVIIFQFYFSYLFNALALRHIPVAYVCLVFNAGPFITCLITFYMFGEHLTRKKLIALVIGFVGLLFTLDISSIPSFTGTWWHIAGLIGAVAANNYGFVLMQNMGRKKQVPLVFLTSLAMLGGSILFGITSLFFPGEIGTIQWPSFFSYLSVIILLGTIVNYGLYVYLLRYYSATFIAFCTFLYTVFGALLGYFLLNEAVGWNFFIASTCIIYGLIMFYQAERGET